MISSRRLKVLIAVGTRPEAIKLAPVIRCLRRERSIQVRLCATAQHRELLDASLRDFGLRPDYDLNLMRPGQTPKQVLPRVQRAVAPVLDVERPDIVLVQGDTTSALGAALAAKTRGIAVAHLEAGLRSPDGRRPYPEEDNRRRIDALADLLLAPTQGAKGNLIKERCRGTIIVTGNTVVDALLSIRPRIRRENLVVVTLHRRETLGKPLESLLTALHAAADRLPHLRWVFPVHPNPGVQQASRLFPIHPRIKLVPPQSYRNFVKLMARSRFIVTDSGGIQEEAPSLGKPVLVVRDVTERPEAFGKGAELVGTAPRPLLEALERWANGGLPKVSRAANPFGDGKAAERVVLALARWGRSRFFLPRGGFHS